MINISVLLCLIFFAASAGAQPASPAPTTEEAEVASPSPTIDNLPWKGSVMFPTKQIELLHNAIRIYEESLGTASKSGYANILRLLPALEDRLSTEQAIANLPDVVPTFHLNSILYINPDNWTLWLNNRKVTPDIPYPEIEVTEVNETSVRLLWHNPHAFNAIAPDWKQNLLHKESYQFTDKDSNVTANIESGEVTFTLFPNQTFVVYDMRIEEGRPAPRTYSVDRPVPESRLDSSRNGFDAIADEISPERRLRQEARERELQQGRGSMDSLRRLQN